ncbi:metal ABC transporter solute-binding protein, Zn/Mn family [Humidisolicoccus flavus]|uniref:metal ABC transporter substrate-binding protein n=1 Tax=Humidisolicoccus flavus TaxID=3111414 RepID=UPI003250BD7C
MATLALAGCSATGDTAGEGSGGEGLQVVATTTQIGDFVNNIVGDDASVTQLLKVGFSAHSFDPSASDLLALGNADVLVQNGAGLEEWLESAIDASGFDGTIIDASTGAHVHESDHDHEHAEDEHSHDEHAEDEHAEDGHAENGHAEDGHAEDEHSHDEHAENEHSHGDHDHDHGGVDPHLWSDPHNAIHMVETIADGLVELGGDSAQTFRSNADDYLAQLEALDAWTTEAFSVVPEDERLLVTNHHTFGYLAETQHITVVGSIMPSFDDNAEVSAAQIDELVAKIKDSGVKAVFSETSINPQVAETIATEAGVAVFSGEDALYSDSLGPEGSAGATYIGSVIHNVRTMIQAWGYEAPSVPSELE